MAEHSATELAARIRAAALRWPEPNPQELAQLERNLSRLPPESQFAVLLEPFISADTFYSWQEYGGLLLCRLRPPCGGQVDELLRSVLLHWDFSVEQLPHYLVAALGAPALLAAAQRLEVLELTARERRALETIGYWLRSRDLPGP